MTTYGTRQPKPFSLRFYRPKYVTKCARCKASTYVKDPEAGACVEHAWVETRTYSFQVAKEESEERSKQRIDGYYVWVANEITAFNKGVTR